MRQEAHPDIRLVMADVDGTLVTPDKQLTARAKQAVQNLRSAGFKFTLTSSRPPFGLRALAQSLQVDLPMVAFNGGMMVSADGQPMQSYPLDQQLMPEMLACLRRYGISPRLYTANQWVIPSCEQFRVPQETATLQMEPTVVSDFSPYYAGVFKVTGVKDDPEALAQCQHELQRQFGGQMMALCSEPYYLDITHPLANKGHALKLVAKTLRIPTNCIAVIGDMPSDVPMFSAAGLSIAMGNASDAVKQQADYVTGANTAEGFAQAMATHLLTPVSASQVAP